MSRSTAVAACLIASVVALSGCSADGSGDSGASGQQESGLLASYDLEGKPAAEIVETLDQTNDDREQQLVGSVTYDELRLTDGTEEVTLPLDSGEFYLAVAPYVSKTHECFYHNLSSCQGELVDEDVEVTIADSTGEVLVDETTQTYDNGFVAFWLPRDIAGTIEVSYDGKTGTVPFATGVDSPTCVTTLQLTG